ncbi:MAG: flagellar biosynthesis anti-sigma factor FlgM [Lachnospiraceae bacterium]|nr:flagellar biosynthesis anti-sigma factor FlgM [Lachnospiraceae bacterium]
MGVDALSQIQQTYGVNKTRRSAQVSQASYGRDSVEISGIGKDIQTAKKAVSDAPDIREDLVASIKAQINDGTYSVSTESFADKLMKKFEELG